MWRVFAVNRIKKENAISTNKNVSYSRPLIRSIVGLFVRTIRIICTIILIDAKIGSPTFSKEIRSFRGRLSSTNTIKCNLAAKNWYKINGERKLYRPLVKGNSKLQVELKLRLGWSEIAVIRVTRAADAAGARSATLQPGPNEPAYPWQSAGTTLITLEVCCFKGISAQLKV